MRWYTLVLLIGTALPAQITFAEELKDNNSPEVEAHSRHKRFLDDIGDAIGGFGDTIGDTLGGLTGSLGGLGDTLGGLTDSLGGLGDTLGGIGGLLGPILGNNQQKDANKAAERRHNEQMALQRQQYCVTNCISEWSAWSLCSRQCGGGMTSRMRQINIPSTCGSDFTCPHVTQQEAPCNAGCPHGGTLKSEGGCDCPKSRAGACCQTAVSCEYPGRPANGDLTGNFPAVYGSVVTYTCNEGYTLVGSHEIMCGGGGNWNGWKPNCTNIQCQMPDIPEKGDLLIRQEVYYFSQEVMYTCDEGYMIQGPETRKCILRGDQGTWDKFTPRCVEKDCGDPGPPLNGDMQGTDFKLGGQVTITCNPGYRLIGSETRTCQTNGQWSGHDTECSAITCEAPTPPRHSTMAPVRETYVFGNTVRLECDPGFTLEGTATLECTPNTEGVTIGGGGKWNNEVPSCKAVICGDPGAPENGAKDGHVYFYPHNVTYTCFAGYILRGARQIHCDRNGAWTAPSPVCEACPAGWYKSDTSGSECVRCPANTHTVTEGSSSVGQCVCDRGYKGPSGGPCQEIECPVLSAPAHGSITECGNKLGDICQGSCEEGYILATGSARRTCLEDESWSGSDAQCQACPMNTFKSDERSCLPCPLHSHTTSTAQSESGCVCDSGYHGNAGGPCNDINECEANSGRGPCQDLCENTNGAYKCGCSIPGYIIDPLDKHTCILDKTCRNLTVNDAPGNGGLVCHWYYEENSQQCAVRCNAGYEFPARINNFEYCGPSTGYLWSHEERGEIIEPCIEEFFPEFRLEADSAYFVTACRNLTAPQQEEVKRQFVEMLNNEGVCVKRQTKVCDVGNVGIICGHSIRRRKRDLSGLEEEVDQVNIQMDVKAFKVGQKVTECDKICTMLRIPANRCSTLCLTTYKRFLRAAVLFSKRQLHTLFESQPERARFEAAQREFEPMENGLRASDVSADCDTGMMADGELCVPCPAGTALQGQRCESCPAGFYQPLERQSTCLLCPIGTTSKNPGASSCTVCPDGRYGMQCNNTCSECIHGTCHAVTGECVCNSGWEGPSCDTDIPGCSTQSCHPGVQCQDVPAPGTGYSCGSCPAGLSGDGTYCVDMQAGSQLLR